MPVTNKKYVQRVIEVHELHSAQLGEDRTVKVCLPPGYEQGKQYPVIYCHDGLEFFTHGRISTIVNQLVDEGKLPPLYIVGIAVSKTHRTDDYAVNGARNRAFVEWVAEDCVPFVESRYAIVQDSSHRFMAGISLGAVATLEMYLRYPDCITNLLLFSGAYYDEVQNRVKAQPQCRNLHAYMVVGRQETDVETTSGNFNFYRLNQKMRDVLRVRGAHVDYREGDGTHIWGFWQKELPQALAWVNQRLQRLN